MLGRQPRGQGRGLAVGPARNIRTGSALIRSSKVLWGEGLFLRPQHFQRQDAYHEWRLAETARAIHPFSWGVRRMRVDSDALANGVLRLTELQAILPDGDLYATPMDDELPEVVSLASLPAGVSEMVFHLALQPVRAAGTNFSGEGQDASAVRYVQRNEQAADWYTGAVESELATLRRRGRLLADNEPHDHLVTLPLVRVRRQATGAFELDGNFVPPAVAIDASPTLQAMLRRLLDVLQAKVDALYGAHREPSQNVIEFRSGDIASFWLLHTCSAAFAGLSHLHHQPQLHPERLYERMLELAGALMTFSKTYGLADLPVYRHEAPGSSFAKLDHIVRELLETVISTRSFAISLSEVRPSYHLARLDSQKIDGNTRLFLGVQAAMQPSEIVESIPQRLKLGAPDDVEKLVLSATSGVRLSHVPQVPVAIPVRPGSYYFAIEPRGPLYERMLQAHALSLYAPANLPELRMELFALNGESA
jgi:type VI secretion system protein ImpJ